MKILCIVQARLNSKRFPNKVLKYINNRSILEILLLRLSKCKLLNQIIVATTDRPEDKDLINHIQNLNFSYYMGSEKNVLERFFKAACFYKADIVVRITGDCPLIDPALVDECIQLFLFNNYDYLSNRITPTYPDGLDTEVFTFKALEKAYHYAKTEYDKEHVTPYIYNSGEFLIGKKSSPVDYSKYRWTLDYEEDLIVLEKIFSHFKPNIYFNWMEIIDLYKKYSSHFKINNKYIRDEGSTMSNGQKLWGRAKKVIPGGTMLFSKRPELFLPEKWPVYFIKSKGCEVWDLDKRKYLDLSFMGVGTNTLGYGHPEVDNAVKKIIQLGNMSTLNCPEEVQLAERLIDIHPWADMARFARTGGEANAIAIRIARAATQKNKVAICGYHGWHDWYLSTNLNSDSNLKGHSIKNIKIAGVPSDLKDTVFSFNYNSIEELEFLINNNDIGIIKMEVMRNYEPKNDFLKKVRELATKNNIVLIFDECTSGFRETFGGLHKKYDVEPDIAIFGKALGNGYAITSVIGKKEVMEYAQETFISSTFWTERIGYVAALKTIEIMEQIKSWNVITDIGKNVKKRWSQLAQKYNLDIEVSGMDSIASFSFNNNNSRYYKTLITQELLNQRIMAGNTLYTCIAHTPKVIDKYFDKLDSVFALIKKCENGENVKKYLQSEVCIESFSRLN